MFSDILLYGCCQVILLENKVNDIILQDYQTKTIECSYDTYTYS